MFDLRKAYKILVKKNKIVKKLTTEQFVGIFEGGAKDERGIFAQMYDILSSIGKIEKTNDRKTPLVFVFPFIGNFFIVPHKMLIVYSRFINTYRRCLLTIEEIKNDSQSIEAYKLENIQSSLIESKQGLRQVVELYIDSLDYVTYKTTYEKVKFRYGNNWDWRLDPEYEYKGILSGNVPKKHFDFFLTLIQEPDLDLVDIINQLKNYQKENDDFILLNSWFIGLRGILNCAHVRKAGDLLDYKVLHEILEKEGITFVYYGQIKNKRDL